MTGGDLTTGHHRRAMLGIVAVSCVLVVSACGGKSGLTPDSQNSPSSSPLPAATQKFCNRVEVAMSSLAGTDPSDTMPLSKARATLDTLLDNGIRGFTALEPDAPASLKQPIRVIVADFRSYKAVADKAKTVKELLASSVTANPTQKSAYEALISYTSDTC
jgi:hypothetical protein